MSKAPFPASPNAAATRLLAKGETLFRQGDKAFAVFAVRRGRMRMVRHLADGRAVVLYFAQDGGTFAEASLFSPAYHCDAVADVASEIEVYPKAALARALDGLPETARSLMAHLAGQVIALRSRLELRDIRTAEERVIHYLQLETNGGQRTIAFARPLKDVAAEIGLTHETFYRTLAKLEAAGVIARDGRTVTLVS
jgi:CRP-like cAMP-binding protein